MLPTIGVVPVKRVLLLVVLLGMVAPLSGCIVYTPPGRGWCYWHPYRCH